MKTNNSKAPDFCKVFEASLSDIASRTDPSTRCIILSGGVDTCAIMAAAKKLGVTFAGALTVITGEESPDKTFAEACAKEHGLRHEFVRLTSEELVDKYLPSTVELLEIFNGMLIRNSLVIAAVFEKAAQLGYKDVIVGDGADELFGGYSFMWRYADPTKWRQKRDAMCAAWTFSTIAIATKYKVTSHAPYCEPATVEWAIANTERSDCIGVRPIRTVHDGPRVDCETGKIILRDAYKTVSSWRRKDPIEVGSGVTVIGHDPYWEKQVSDQTFKLEVEKLLKRGYVIDRKEQLVNFRAFEHIFGVDGCKLEIKRLPIGEGCIGCCFPVEKDFCHMCGAYPARRDRQILD